MSIRRTDERLIIRPTSGTFDTPPLPAVVAVDAIFNVNNLPFSGVGTGITITPKLHDPFMRKIVNPCRDVSWYVPTLDIYGSFAKRIPYNLSCL